MKVGDYIRSSWGTFSRIKEYEHYEDSEEFSILLEGEKYSIHYKNKSQFDNDYKSSPNIIDLIEVGDYVNGFKVDEIDEKGIYNYNSYDGWRVNIANCNEAIKSIVAKELLEVAYKVV